MILFDTAISKFYLTISLGLLCGLLILDNLNITLLKEVSISPAIILKVSSRLGVYLLQYQVPDDIPPKFLRSAIAVCCCCEFQDETTWYQYQYW